MPDLEFLVIEGLKVAVRQGRVSGGRPSGARVRTAVTKPTLLGALLDFLRRVGPYAYRFLFGALELGAVVLKLFLREARTLRNCGPRAPPPCSSLRKKSAMATGL